ncbi:MAG TPA: PEP-CTERM sorting domain-containing protein [Pyrinomonadaceae bacterium]|nr:PEP-CTERM sorting domain-containing protein [Pyrinomonadaceae bacterium]
MPRAPRGALSICFLLVLFSAQARADDVVLDFEGGTAGSAIGSFYSPLGVTFSNAQFINVSGFPQPSALGFSGISGPGPSNPIVISFASLKTLVTLNAIDISGQGFLMSGYSENDVLLGTAGYLSPGPNFPISFSVTGVGTGIKYVKVFQPLNTSGSSGGVAFDNLFFSDTYSGPPPPSPNVPEPATLVLLGLGLSGTATVCSRRRRKARRMREGQPPTLP